MKLLALYGLKWNPFLPELPTEALLAGTKAELVLLHPNMGAEYRKQVANLAQELNQEENRGEAADILRSPCGTCP